MYLLHTAVTFTLLLSFCQRFISSPHFSYPHLPHSIPFYTACKQYSYLTSTSFAVLSIATCPCTYRCRNYFLLAFLLLSGDIELNPGPTNFTVCTLNIRSILTDTHSAALSGLTVSHHPDLVCLTETWIKPTTTITELANCTPPNYTFCSFPRNSSNRTRTDIGGGTGFFIREPFKQVPTSLPKFTSFESSSVTLKLPHSMLSVFNIYRPPLSSRSSKPFSVFLDEFSSFLSTAATTPH